MDVYKAGKGVIKKLPSCLTKAECEAKVEEYCQENNVQVIAREYCDTAHWNYLSDGTEIDFCLENC